LLPRREILDNRGHPLRSRRGATDPPGENASRPCSPFVIHCVTAPSPAWRKWADTFTLLVEDQSFRSYLRGRSAEELAAGVFDAVQQPALLYGNLEIRPEEIQALAEGRRVGLTVREFQVLLILAEREDRVLRRADIYSGVWGGEMKYRDRSVDVFVRKVRNKLAHAAPGWAYIHTHFGVGYRFAAIQLGGEDSDPTSTATAIPEPAGP
jgi:DNA-binding winged helix-turn-helix (wHTH) protein